MSNKEIARKLFDLGRELGRLCYGLPAIKNPECMIAVEDDIEEIQNKATELFSMIKETPTPKTTGS